MRSFQQHPLQSGTQLLEIHLFISKLQFYTIAIIDIYYTIKTFKLCILNICVCTIRKITSKYREFRAVSLEAAAVATVGVVAAAAGALGTDDVATLHADFRFDPDPRHE